MRGPVVRIEPCVRAAIHTRLFRPVECSRGKCELWTTREKLKYSALDVVAAEETISLIKSIACSSCDITVLDMNRPDIAELASSLGVRSVPAVVINGELAGCCAGRGPDEQTLRSAGLGVPL